MRYRQGISPADRIGHGGMLYTITIVINSKSRYAALVRWCACIKREGEKNLWG
jgi:hypothetical protein